MKILHVAESVQGGCGTYLNEMLPLQSASLGSAQVRCIAPRQHLAQLHRLEPGQLLPFERPGRAQGLPGLARAVWQAVRDWQPDLVHAHSTFAGAVVRGLSLLRPMPPVVYCPHGWVFDVELPAAARGLTKLAERWMSHRCARIVAISEHELQQGLEAGIRARRMALVRNGVSPLLTDEVAPWPDDRLRLLFVGRLDRQKGADILLQAVAPLQAQVCVRIVGERVHAGTGARLPQMAHVGYTGWLSQQQVAAQINACDAVVMPSRWEGFGLVAVEAMRAGKPVLASAVGGLREIVVDGLTGHLFPPDDAPALGSLLAGLDRPRLQRMGADGLDRFLAHYTSGRTHDGLLQLYASVLGPSAVQRVQHTVPAAGAQP